MRTGRRQQQAGRNPHAATQGAEHAAARDKQRQLAAARSRRQDGSSRQTAGRKTDRPQAGSRQLQRGIRTQQHAVQNTQQRAEAFNSTHRES